MSPATLLDELAALDPQERREVPPRFLVITPTPCLVTVYGRQLGQPRRLAQAANHVVGDAGWRLRHEASSSGAEPGGLVDEAGDLYQLFGDNDVALGGGLKPVDISVGEAQ